MGSTTTPAPGPRAAGWTRRWAGALLVLLAVVLGAVLRVQAAWSDEGLGGRPAEGLLQSDPGLLHYLTSRWVEEGGPPPDLGADPRIAHPGTTDGWAEYTVGQEALVWMLRPLFPRDWPLHRVCLWIFAATAAATAFGVGLAGRELAGSWLHGGLAALVFALAPAAYRTVGFVLVREDLALPLLALHVGLALRAVRTGRVGSALLAGLAGAMALASWHAMAFVLLLEAGLVAGWCLRGGPSALRGTAGLAVGLPVVLAAVGVPALASRATLGSPLVGVLVGLVAVGRTGLRGIAALGAVLALAAGWTLALGEGGELAHVHELVLARLRFGSAGPVDPTMLSFEARLLWQGPFASPGAAAWLESLGWLWPLVLLGALRGLPAWRARQAGMALVVLALPVAVGAAWIAGRMLPLVALVGSMLTVFALPRGGGQARGLLVACGLAGVLVLQVTTVLGPALTRPLAWYRPLARQDELVQLVQAVRREVPEGEAVGGDFMTSTAVLTHTRRPVLLQPKWETRAARERVRGFWEVFYGGTPGELAEWLGGYGCRYLVVDRYVLGRLGASRVLAGMGPGEGWRAGSAAEAFLGGEGPGEVEGYERVWAGGRFLGLYRVVREGADGR